MNSNDMIDLYHPKNKGAHLINVKTKSVKGHLVFVIQEMVWSDARQNNKYSKKINMLPHDFAIWYAAKDAEGWRIMS
jgi:hypothetical protein